MFEFYYDFVNTYIERLLFHYLETDTDSTYMSLVGFDVDSLVNADMREQYFLQRHVISGGMLRRSSGK